MTRWSRDDLIAIDEVGYVALAEVGAALPFSEWTQVIPNVRLCKALLDRITDRARILETGAESYRFRRQGTNRREERRETPGGNQIAMEMPARGKHGKPNPGFPPFPLPLDIPQNRRDFHISAASTTDNP
jgi:hypothetical protein